MSNKKPEVVSKNRRASFEYSFIDEFTAGMQLTGTEIKSIRAGEVNLTDAFCAFRGDELYVQNMHIAPYAQGTHYNHEAKRDRKLLLRRPELRKLQAKLKDQGLTIIPTVLLISDKGFAKLGIALAKGKKLHDKREDIKKRDTQREMDRE
jgi:SsrA-binding protein